MSGLLSGAPEEHRHRRSRLVAAVALCSALVVAVGCTVATERSEYQSRTQGGPLQVRGGGVGSGADDPPPQGRWDDTEADPTWSLTVGGFLLCTEDASADIHIEGIDGAVEAGGPAPISVSAAVRRLTTSQAAAAPDGTTKPPVLGTRGSPPLFAEAYADGMAPLAGETTEDLETVKVFEPCSARPDRFDFTELLATVSAGEDGARVRELTVQYRADGERYELVLPFEVVLCGVHPSESLEDTCPAGR